MEQHPDAPNQRNAWCSWCYEVGPHLFLAKHFVSRNSYRCQLCLNETAKCLTCSENMARSFSGTADRLCFKCNPRFSLATTKSDMIKITTHTAWCSWCLEKKPHKLYSHNDVNPVARDAYMCSECNRKSHCCRVCEIAMARAGATFNDELCLVCDGTIQDWLYEGNLSKVRKVGWCSWCIERTNHSLEQTNIIRRDIYACDDCGSRTLPCSKCSDGMCRGGSGWDDSYCCHCNKEGGGVDMSWEKMKEMKDAIFEGLRDIERVKSELSRDSEPRRLAEKEGMLRPFLLLVAMPPIFRNRIASFLGWSIITQSYFGDPHSEAWDIIHAHQKGIQSRANSGLERINPLARNVNWFEILYRVTHAIFSKVDAPQLSNADAMKESKDVNSEAVKKLEEEFLLNVAQMMEKTKRERGEDSDDRLSKEYMERIAKNTGMTREEIYKYSVAVAKNVAGFGNISTAVFAAKTAVVCDATVKSVVPQLAGVVAPFTAAVASLATPLFFLGIFSLTKQAFTLGLGSSESRLFGPIVLMLNQLVLLAMEGLDITEYSN